MSFAVTACENKTGECGASVGTNGGGGGGGSGKDELLFVKAIFRSKELT